MATIGDVAKYAGVSRSTVSHALSGKRTISQATRERVNEAVRVLNYRANAGARALATARTMILALVVPFTPEEFAPATMQYVLVVTQTARSLGYDVLLVTQEEGADGIARVAESNLVDGVIILDVKRNDPRVGVLSQIRQPGVLIGMPDGEPAVDCVDFDFGAAGALLVDHLAERGHREVIFLTLPDELFAQGLGYAVSLSGSVNVPDTGGWQTWATATASVTLPAGQQTLTVDQDNGGWNLPSLAFAAAGGGTGSALTASPSSLAFGSTLTGSASPAQTVTVSNPNSTAVSVSQP